jgi:adenylosuccinate lyase
MRAWESGGDFRAAIASDPDVTSRLTPEQLAYAFSLERQLTNVDTIFARVFG